MTNPGTAVAVAGGYPPPKLAEGTRVRHREHPELTGVIKHYEWNAPGVLSAIPYCIGWDDSALACERLGFLFVYATDDGVEPELTEGESRAMDGNR